MRVGVRAGVEMRVSGRGGSCDADSPDNWTPTCRSSRIFLRQAFSFFASSSFCSSPSNSWRISLRIRSAAAAVNSLMANLLSKVSLFFDFFTGFFRCQKKVFDWNNLN